MQIRTAGPDDAAGVWQLVEESEALDLNSPYAYLLGFDHHGPTSVVAEDDGRVVGFVLSYRPPPRPESVFVWQVGVAASHRRMGLGRRLLHGVLDRDACADVRYMEATVTPSNGASMALFRGIAEDYETDFTVEPCFSADQFPPGEGHEPEDLVRIGPLPPGPDRSATEPKG